MRCLIVSLFFLTLVTTVSATKTIPIDTSSSRVAPLTTPTIDKDEAIAALQANLADANQRLHDLQTTLAEVQKKQDDVAARNADLLAQKVALEKTSTDDKAAIQALKDAQAKLQEQLATQTKVSDQVTLLQQQIADQKAALDKAQLELTEAQKRAASATASADAATAASKEHDSLAAERDAVVKERDAQAAQIKTLQAQVASLTAASGDASADTARAVDHIAELTEAGDDLARDKSELESELADLKSQLADYNTVKQQAATLQAELARLKAGTSQAVAMGQHVAQDQWNALFAQVTANLTPVRRKLQQITDMLPDLSRRSTEVVSGRKVAVDSNATLRREKADLEKRLAAVGDFDAKFAALQKEKDSADTTLKELTAATKDKEAQLAALTAKVTDLQTQLESTQAAMEDLKSSEIAPAAQLRAQLVALKQLMVTFIARTQRQMNAIGEKMAPLADACDAATTHGKQLKALERTLKALEDNVRELIDLAKQLSTLKRGSKSSTDSEASSSQLKQVQEQLASVTAQYNQLVQEANNRVQALQDQMIALQAKATDGSGLKDDVVRLQQQLDDEKKRREIDASIAQQIRDASVSAKLDAQHSALLQAQLDAQRDRQTDTTAATTQAMAGQAFATGIAAATKTAAPTGGLSLADLQAVFSRYGTAPTPQVINNLPSQYQPYMSSMAQLPQFGPMGTPQQVSYATGQLAQNRTTYLDTYVRAISFLQNPAARNNIGAFNSLEATVFNAVSREGYLWYQRGTSAPRGSPINMEARNNLKMLSDQVATPLRNLKAEFERQGVTDYRQPEDLVAKFTNFRRQLGETL